MRGIASIMIDGRGYFSCTLESGDSLAAVCLYFGYTTWQAIYNLPANNAFRQIYPDPNLVDGTYSGSLTFYIPAQSGCSGQQAITRLSQLETYCRQIEAMERVESNATRLVTYIRKIYYESGGWDIIIPRARNIDMPASMRNNPDVALAIRYLSENQELSVDGRFVDIGHFFTGLDARNYQQRLELGPSIWGTTIPVVQLRDNREVATWVEDLGSVVVEYLSGTPCPARPRGHSLSFYDITRTQHTDILRDYYNNWSGATDMRGNIDGLIFPFDGNQRLSQQFRSYFITNTDPRRQRFVRFRQQINMSNSDSWKRPVNNEVFNGAIAYAGGTGRRLDVINIFRDPGPGIIVPTFWEAYSNVSDWVVNMFVNWMMSATF
jgi:hypothetical protein